MACGCGLKVWSPHQVPQNVSNSFFRNVMYMENLNLYLIVMNSSVIVMSFTLTTMGRTKDGCFLTEVIRSAGVRLF